jgi:hypothetical protein
MTRQQFLKVSVLAMALPSIRLAHAAPAEPAEPVNFEPPKRKRLAPDTSQMKLSEIEEALQHAHRVACDTHHRRGVGAYFEHRAAKRHVAHLQKAWAEREAWLT